MRKIFDRSRIVGAIVAFGLAMAMLAAAPGEVLAKSKFSFAYVSDPTHEVYLYGIRNGHVTSDSLELELVTLAIPALVQAFMARQYDAVQTASIAIPRAVDKGLDVRMLNTVLGRLTPGPTLDIWVRRDSPVQSIEDLQGKKIATFGLGSTAFTMMRVALAKEHGFDMEIQGGDFEFVELPTATIPAAIASGEVEAGRLLYNQVYEAEQSGDFRSVYSASETLYELAGARPVLPVIVGYPDAIEQNEELYREFNRMLTESVRYAAANSEAVTGAVAAEAGVDAAYLSKVLMGIAEFETPIEEQDVKALTFFWQAAKEVGILTTAPDAMDLVWKPAMQQ